LPVFEGYHYLCATVLGVVATFLGPYCKIKMIL
jgi:hypothetical protein